jgi:hypothetical protein
MAELKWNSNHIFVLTRHTIIDFSRTDSSSFSLQDTFYKAFPQLEGLQIFEVTDTTDNQKLDVLFFAKNKEDIDVFLKSNQNNSIKLEKNQNWLSWQYASSGQNLSKPCSEGHSMAIELDEQAQYNGYLGLPKGQKNFSSPGSSGSVVWNVDERSKIYPLGIIICKQDQPTGAIQDSLMRVLSFEKIMNGTIEPIEFYNVIKTISNLQVFPYCTPVDRETVGGDHRIESGESF